MSKVSITNKKESPGKFQERFMVYFFGLLIASVAALSTSIYCYFIGDMTGFISDLVLSIMALGLVVFLKIKGDNEITGTLILIYITLAMLSNAQRLNIDPGGIFWLLIFPMPSFIIKGPKKGLLYSIVYLFLMITILQFTLQSSDLRILLNFSLVLITIILTNYFYVCSLKKWKDKLERALEESEILANYDTLTDLPNRRLFDELCEFSLKNARRNALTQATLFIDIDGFKAVNDSLGHNAGDTLLIAISERLKQCIRKSDIVSRFGGDEFVIHLGGDCNHKDAQAISEKIVTSLSHSFELSEGTANIGASIGVSVFPDDADNVQQLIKHADQAMYAAKASGKGQVKLFSEL